MEKVIAEGKTKRIAELPCVRVHAKDDLTAGDGRKHDVLTGKAELATRTTSNVFSLLRKHGIPVAFYAQDSTTSFLAPPCRMIPLEVVVRAKAYGSYLKQHPELKKGDEFPELLVQLFLKSKDKRFKANRLMCDDPLMRFVEPRRVGLYLPTEPETTARPFLHMNLIDIFDEISDIELLEPIKELARKTFAVLQKAWKALGKDLVDFKLEFGIGPDGTLYVADVIDNDSWRLIDNQEHLDKQVYRDGDDMDLVLQNYRKVADLTDQLVLQKAA